MIALHLVAIVSASSKRSVNACMSVPRIRLLRAILCFVVEVGVEWEKLLAKVRHQLVGIPTCSHRLEKIFGRTDVVELFARQEMDSSLRQAPKAI